jgi:hypothetical protein
MRHLSENIWFSWQNLSEKKPKQPLWKNGRAWLHIAEKCVTIEWNVGKGWPLAHINIGGGDGDNKISLSLSFPFIGFYHIAFEGFVPRKYFPKVYRKNYAHPGEMWNAPVERQIGISINDGYVFISLWENPDEWNKTDPWWWKFSFNPADIILGHQKYSEKELLTTTEMIPLPEASYAATVRIVESKWKRPRWPWPMRMLRAKITPSNPIPTHAGKGENSWDLDDDYLYDMTCQANTPKEAAQKVADSVMRERRRYGLPDCLEGIGYAPSF